jgi:hypothetical protein
MSLTLDEISELLKPTERPEQNGRIRWYDREMRCASRGCSSPTYIKLDGIQLCPMHTLHKCNELLSEGR